MPTAATEAYPELIVRPKPQQFAGIVGEGADGPIVAVKRDYRQPVSHTSSLVAD